MYFRYNYDFSVNKKDFKIDNIFIGLKINNGIWAGGTEISKNNLHSHNNVYFELENKEELIKLKNFFKEAIDQFPLMEEPL